MRNTFLIVLSIGYLFFYTGCKRTCQSYPEKYLNWIPFEDAQEMRFTNSQDTITFIINGFSKTIEYEVNKRNDVACEATASFVTETDNYLNTYIQGFSSCNENSKEVFYTYTFHQDYLFTDDFYIIINNGIIDDNENFHEYHFFDKISINTREYSNVIHLKKEASETERNIVELYIAENIGIIKFVENNGTNWILIE